MRAWVLSSLLIATIASPAAAQSLPADPPPPVGDVAARDRWLGERIDAAIAGRPDLVAAKVGVLVVDAQSGRVLFKRLADEPFNLASNTKLVTLAAGLARLGREYAWETVVAADAFPDDKGVIAGDLVVHAGGDPSLDAGALWQLAADLRAAGVKSVKGRLVIDDTFFDGETLPPAYEQKQEDAAHRAPVSAASLDYNAVSVWILPGATEGAPARVLVDPPSDYFKVTGGATTVAKGGDVTVTTKAIGQGAAAQTEITVAGSIRVDDTSGEAFGRPVAHPSLFFGATLKKVLAAAGIKVERGVVLGTMAKTQKILVRHKSDPLCIVMREAALHSINFVAEDILKTLGAEGGGAPGTWDKGKAAVSEYLAGIGIAPGTYRYDNGSGLYDSNRFTPAQLVTLLRAVWLDFRLAPDFVSALPLAGADGTLARRLHGGTAERYVRAKTGTLNDVITLSGYAGGVAKPALAFAILVNDIPEKPGTAKESARELTSDVAELIARYVDTE
jgi:D-alanyl-D-alanine carboxypeptidase/D-alanyl-D-alanine-endopeptidase (penicillin-binding protein 4)